MTAEPRVKVAILADMLEEGWPSMDLAADMLLAELQRTHAQRVEARLVRPALIPVTAWRRDEAPPTRDRVLNRYWLYRRAVRTVREWADVFHIIDHSYAHLVHGLPAERTVVTCHDIDAFVRSQRRGDDSSRLPGYLVRRTATGLARAARVVCPSRATASALSALGNVAFADIAVVPNGVDEPHGSPAELAHLGGELLGPVGRFVDILHVGSTIPRKRIDVLLEVFADLCRTDPRVRLVRVGGVFTDEQRAHADRLGVTARILQLPLLSRDQLLAVYHRAATVVSTSEREGFCLPVVEALSAGIPVVVPDMPVFREVAGNAGVFVNPDKLNDWPAAIRALLAERERDQAAWAHRRERARARGTRFSWKTYASSMADLYVDLARARERDAAARTREAS
jgi:glycosyltransferase involved in cell wall biosynthesis